MTTPPTLTDFAKYLTGFISQLFAGNPARPLLTWTPGEEETRSAVLQFLEKEPEWFEHAIQRDPALSSKPRDAALEELLTYQGLHAIAFHQQAHEKYLAGDTAEARRISQGVRRLTAGIEIHPGASIGKNFFIDHGAGVVIGETAKIGDNVMLYHRVTLGSDGREKPAGERRHPQIGDNTTLYTGAEILGAATVGNNVVIGSGTKIFGDVHIGDGASIGPNLVIRKDVRPGGKVIASTPLGELQYDNTGAMKAGSLYERERQKSWQQTVHP